MSKKRCPTCRKDVTQNRLALKTHWATAKAIAITCTFGKHKPGRPKMDPEVVKKNKREIWKKRAAIKRENKRMKEPEPLLISPEPLLISPEPLINSMDQKPKAQAKLHFIDSELVKRRVRRMDSEILFGLQ